jgi:hypothetical protein
MIFAPYIQAWVGTIAKAPSQTLVRYNFLASHAGNVTHPVPYASDAVPVRSYFVYDGELPRTATVLWAFGHGWKLRGGKKHAPIPSKVRGVAPAPSL